MRSEEEIREKLKAIEKEMAIDKHTRTWEVKGKAWTEFAKWVLNDKGDSLKDGEKP